MFFQMGTNKAPGSDGLPPFFKKNWELVGLCVCDFVRHAFEVGKFLETLNKTLITLIPKQDVPEKISHLRPILLCNIVVKCLTKIIVNRFKILMPKLVREEQSSFILGRQGIDNIMIVQEIVHSMYIKVGGKGTML